MTDSEWWLACPQYGTDSELRPILAEDIDFPRGKDSYLYEDITRLLIFVSILLSVITFLWSVVFLYIAFNCDDGFLCDLLLVI